MDDGGLEPPAVLRRELLPPPERIRRFFSLIEERLGAATAYDGVLAVGSDICLTEIGDGRLQFKSYNSIPAWGLLAGRRELDQQHCFLPCISSQDY